VSQAARDGGLGVRETGRVRLRALRRLGLEPSAAEFELHSAVGRWRFEPTPEFLDRTAAWFEKIHAANTAARVLSGPVLAHVLADRWYLACSYAARHTGLRAVGRYVRSPFARPFRLGVRPWLRFTRRAVLGWLRVPPHWRP
jgi:hypothetical protein